MTKVLKGVKSIFQREEIKRIVFLKAKPAKLPDIKKTTQPDKIPVKVVIMLADIIDKHIT